MLVSLTIQNVVLIETLSVEFQNGLCALTGETGAGKSILLDSLGLALGSRSDSALVRKGADQASVSALFEVPAGHPAFALLQDANMAGEGDSFGTLILRRSIGKDGRSRAFINDQPVSAGLLRAVGASLVEIHGQFDTQGLLDPATHREMLDSYAGIGNSLLLLYENWKEKEADCETLQSDMNKMRAEEEYLRQALEDLDALAPQEGEEEELAAMREKLMHREKVLEGLNAAYAALDGEEDPVRTAWGCVDRIADRLGDKEAELITGALSRAAAEVQDALAAIQNASEGLQDSDQDLETLDERLFALRAQARKHGCGVKALPLMRTELAEKLSRIEQEDDLLAQALKAAEGAKAAYSREAEKVRTLRKEAARKLDAQIAGELAPLKLDKARFVTSLEDLPEAEWGPCGMDRVRFLVATNPGAAPGPLHKIASGGEMARFMLALKVVLAETGRAGSLIFDEVDSGIGGATADAVGERLARLACARQVLVVTHSPQVAARAGYHYIVKKEGSDQVSTKIVPLSSRLERCEEIARLLAGAEITQEARAAAGKLLETGT